MTLRITFPTEGEPTTIRVEGHLTQRETPVLNAEYWLAGPRTQLDLSGLFSCDRAGIEMLRSLRAEGAELYGASPYIHQLLKGGRP